MRDQAMTRLCSDEEVHKSSIVNVGSCLYFKKSLIPGLENSAPLTYANVYVSFHFPA